ncbi:MAG TPA: AAA family ATPase, partial [Pseudomonadales bacterium]|nr:AAA family ATPase [Pseudomonadales bacterium]
LTAANARPIASNSVELLPEQLLEQLPGIATLLQTGAAKGLVLRGHPSSGRTAFSQRLATQMQQKALQVPLDLWQRQPGLALACYYAGWLPVLKPNLGPGEVWRPGAQPKQLPVVILLGTDGAVESSDYLELSMPLPAPAQRQRIWHKELLQFGADRRTIEEIAEEMAANALLSGPIIQTLAQQASLLAQRQPAPLNRQHLVLARRQMGAERLRLLAQPVEREVNQDAIVLPPLVSADLDRLINRARQRESLWRGLGITLQQTATAGLRALFTGDSGTGKTLAASYIATRLGAPLYRVDLSAVMNKYIGESEKNLSALLDMAAASDVVLLFDEADSLFGKRSEGKETGERFANMLTHFLLTRIENHPGIVILTSNNRERIDAAFTRRLDLIVEFPQPGFEERLQLWRSHLGERGPGDTAYKLMAGYCHFSGGQLRNVVLTAAALAGDGAINGAHLLQGLEAEYRKIGRELPVKLTQLTLLESSTHE